MQVPLLLRPSGMTYITRLYVVRSNIIRLCRYVGTPFRRDALSTQPQYQPKVILLNIQQFSNILSLCLVPYRVSTICLLVKHLYWKASMQRGEAHLSRSRSGRVLLPVLRPGATTEVRLGDENVRNQVSELTSCKKIKKKLT